MKAVRETEEEEAGKDSIDRRRQQDA